MPTIKPQNTSTEFGYMKGFSLIEVLIALIIMSVGMLGIAGLYVHGIQAGRTSLFRHHAVTLAGDVADRIRANPTAGLEYEGAGANNACIAGGVNCTPDEMAANDIYQWDGLAGGPDGQADRTLPDGDVTVDYDNAAVPSVYTVTVSWSEPGQDPPPTYVIKFPVFEM